MNKLVHVLMIFPNSGAWIFVQIILKLQYLTQWQNRERLTGISHVASGVNPAVVAIAEAGIDKNPSMQQHQQQHPRAANARMA